MASTSVAFPIQADKIEQARQWGQEKMSPRRAELTEANRRIGLTRESWHLQQMPTGALLILSCEGRTCPVRSPHMRLRMAPSSAGRSNKSRS